MTLHYTLRPCPLGWVLAAFTPKGIAAVALGDDGTILLQALGQRFPSHQVAEAGADYAAWSDAVLEAVSHPAKPHALPLNVLCGTAFQQQVWKALAKIEPGTTVTYQALAQSMGRPQAVRALANACGANPWAVLVPCHRVLRSDGSVSGYRWGVARKQWLLAQEGVEVAVKPNKMDV